MATVEERFQAAVNVIKGLPKNGPYQPSNTMMLKFYGYFKQATEGPVSSKKPAFWDVVGRAKWEAWNDNRHLTRQQAMERYVESLREIIETMSFTANVQDFVGSISGLDNINLDEVELIAPGMRELAESHPDSPFNSRTNSPQHGVSANGVPAADVELDSVTPIMNGHHDHDTLEPQVGDTSLDTSSVASLPLTDNPAPKPPIIVTTAHRTISNGIIDDTDDEYGDPVDINQELTDAMLHNSELLKQVQATVLRMNADMVTLNQRMSVLEKSITDLRAVQKTRPNGGHRANGRGHPKWWPFNDISPTWFVLLVLWPFVVKRMSRMLAAPRRQ